MPVRSRRRVVPPGGVPTTVVWVLIALNVAVFVAWHTFGQAQAGRALMDANFLVSADRVFEGQPWTLITSAFSHVDTFHLLVNMLVLWVFGRDVVQVTGSRSFVWLYLVGGLLASVGHLVFGLLTGDLTPALGASGSVMAVAVVFAFLWPKRILLLNFFIPVPAALAVGLYILLDVLGVFAPRGNVAHAAHLGGAAYGLLYWWVRLRPRTRPRRR